MSDADKVRIRNEAMVRTAMEQPDFAQREFEKWRALKETEVGREIQDQSFVTAWAKVAWLAEGQMRAMGRELAKAQARIGRQRRANRDLISSLRAETERRERLERQLKQALRQWRMYANDERQHDGVWIETSEDPEARMYQDAAKVLETPESPGTGEELVNLRDMEEV